MTEAKRSRGTDLSFLSPFFLSPFSLAVHKDVAFDAHGVRGAEPASVSGSGNGGPEKEEEEERRGDCRPVERDKRHGRSLEKLEKARREFVGADPSSLIVPPFDRMVVVCAARRSERGSRDKGASEGKGKERKHKRKDKGEKGMHFEMAHLSTGFRVFDDWDL